MAPIMGYKSPLFGTAGLERTYDRELVGLDELRPGGEMLRKFRPDASDPSDLCLSVDVRLQGLAARLLGDRRGAVVAIEPSTGRILALVSTPTYDPALLSDPATGRELPRDPGPDDAAPLLDRATQGRYVPGSVFKLVTAVAGLESGAIDRDTTFADQPEESRRGFRGRRLPDPGRRRGPCSWTIPWTSIEAMEVSSNIWFAHAGLEAGSEALSSVAARFGFGSAIDFELPTSASQVNGGDGPLDGFADRVELANAAYGQAEVLVTPLQMALVAAAIANGGVMMRPTLVDRLVSENGNEVRIEPRAVGRVMSAEHAAVLQRRDGAGGRGPLRGTVCGRREGVRGDDGRQERHRAARPRTGTAFLVRRLRAGRASRASPSSWSSRTAARGATARCPWAAGS